jgi:hypothetical protein
VHTDRASEWLRKNINPRKHNSVREIAYKLLEYVSTATNRRHYNEIASILAHCYHSDQKPGDLGDEGQDSDDDQIYKMLSSPDALKQLYRRRPKFPPK